MKRVYSAQNTLMVDHLKHVLDAEGIDCVVRNRYLTGAAGRLPPNECWMELWVLDDAQLPVAQRAIEKAFQAEDTPIREMWTCPQCGEKLEPQFEACWKCSTQRGAAVEEASYSEKPPVAVPFLKQSILSSDAQLWIALCLMALVVWYLLRTFVSSPY